MRFMALKALVPAILICASIVPAWSQSTDFSRPTALTTVPLVAEHDGTKNVSNFYSFEAGPGSILVTFDGHATKNSSSAQVKLWDQNRNALGDVYLVAQTSPSSATKRFNFAKKQKVVLETVFHEDTTMGVLPYSVNITGAVQFAKEPAAATSAQASTTSPAPSAANKTGKLRIEMKDGSIKEFDMSTVRRFYVE